jgi:hypothetical protein
MHLWYTAGGQLHSLATGVTVALLAGAGYGLVRLVVDVAKLARRAGLPRPIQLEDHARPPQDP